MTEELSKKIISEEVGGRHTRWLGTRYASWSLAVISFVESVFFPIIIDPFLVAFILARREQWLKYVLISIIFSVLGGIAGYFLGLMFFDFIGTKIISLYHLDNQFVDISAKLDANGFVFVLIGALTPVPYKLVAIASGVVQLSFATFIVASIVGRTLRLGLVGYGTYALGPSALPLFRKHILKLAYFMGVVLAAYLLFRLL